MGTELNVVFPFLLFFPLLTWNQDDDGKVTGHNVLTSSAILPELTCSLSLAHKCFLCLREQGFKPIMATGKIKKRVAAHLLLLKLLLYFLLKYSLAASLT